MGLVGNFFSRLSGGGGPQAQSVQVSGTATGTVATIARLLGSSSTLSLITGTSGNLTLSGLNIQAAAALGAGASQQAVVREYDSATLRAVEYPVTVSTPASVPAAPTLGAVTAGSGQLSIAYTDGATGGSAITAHKVYRSTTTGPETLLGTVTGASPFVDTGLTNGVKQYYRFSAVNSVGEGPLSNEVSGTPSAQTALITNGLVARWSADAIPTQADNTALLSWTDSVGGIVLSSAQTNKPSYRVARQNGKPSISWTQQLAHMTTSGANAALTAVQSAHSTVFIVYKNPTSTDQARIFTSDVNSNDGVLYARSTDVGGSVSANFSYPLANSGALETMALTVRPQGEDGGTVNGVRLYLRGCCVSDQNSNLFAASAAAISIGGPGLFTSTGGYLGELFDILVWNRTLSSPEIKQVEKWARDKYASPYPWAGAPYFRIFQGNSIENGYGTPPTVINIRDSAPRQLANAKGWALGTWENIAEVGLNWDNMKATALRDIDPLPALLGVPIQLHAWEWNNSRGNGAAAVYSSCTSYFQARRSAGISRLIVSTSIDVSDGNETAQGRTDRATYNANIAANWATFADAYAPFHTDPNIGAEEACPASGSGGTYFDDDLTHLKPAGMAVMAGLISAAAQ